MPYNPNYEEATLTPEQVPELKGPVVLEFGASWCGICRGAAPDIKEAFESFPQVQHIKIEDGPGKRLGRSFRVKLWPTLVFLRDGQVVQQTVRPESSDEIREGLQAITQDSEA